MVLCEPSAIILQTKIKRAPTSSPGLDHYEGMRFSAAADLIEMFQEARQIFAQARGPCSLKLLFSSPTHGAGRPTRPDPTQKSSKCS